MNYTKNTPLKLKALGFEFFYSHEETETETENLHYEVWKKGVIDVAIEHVPGKKVLIDITETDGVDCKSLEDLCLLDKMINAKPCPQKS